MIKVSLEQLLKINKNELSGKTICFGTDTVYGIGVMVDSNIKTGLNKIYKMKKRDLSKPLAILAPSTRNFLDFVDITYNKTNELLDLWPGALTLIFKKKDHKFDDVTTLDTIGFRIPNSKVTLDILNYLDLLATTSVNLSGQEPINDIQTIEKEFNEFIDYLVTDPVSTSKVSSTVIDISTNEKKIIRKGDLIV